MITTEDALTTGDLGGVKPGDVMLEVNRKPKSSVEQFKTEWNPSKDRVVLLVQRGEAATFVAIRKCSAEK